jgi:type I restriction enzyme, S subunit
MEPKIPVPRIVESKKNKIKINNIKIGMFPRDVGTANCGDLVITRLLSGLCSEYGAIYVCSPAGQSRLSLRETGIAQPHFNVGAMRVKAFPLPPFRRATGNRHPRRGDVCVGGSDRGALRERPRADNKLTPSHLGKAFRGELVPTEADLADAEGREFESATQLLARIKSRPTPVNRNGAARHRTGGKRGARLGP